MPYITQTNGHVRIEDGNTGEEVVQLSARLAHILSDPTTMTPPETHNLVPYWNRLAQSFRILLQYRLRNVYKLTDTFVNTRFAPKPDALPPCPTEDSVAAAQAVLNNFASALGNVARKYYGYHDDYDMCRRVDKLVNTFYRNVVGPIARDARDLIENSSSNSFDEVTGSTAKTVIHEIMCELLLTSSNDASLGTPLAVYHLRWGDLMHHTVTFRSSLAELRRTMRGIMRYDDEAELSEWVRDNYDFEECGDCGDWEYNGYLQATYHDGCICRGCADNHYTFSDYHDRYVHNDYAVRVLGRDGESDHIHENERDNGNFEWNDNEECYVHVDYCPPSKVLRRYHTSKNNDAYRFVHSDWSARTNRFFGIELEVECRKGYPGEHADRLNDALNDGNVGTRCFFEEDGSLSHGFEIITQPMGLDSHYQFWEWLTDKTLTKDLRSHDTSTCGLHIHINRDNIKDLQINKIVTFIHAPDNSNLIKAIARRYGVGYASMHAKKLATAHRASRDDARYEAVNLLNRRTIEMRIFKGTLKHGSMLAALEFTNALISFTAPASPAGFVLNTHRFMDYINSNEMKPDTRNLRKYLIDVGFTS